MAWTRFEIHTKNGHDMEKQDMLLSDFLTGLGVPHTTGYSNARFASMPFKTLFGLSKLLEEYGIESRGIQLSKKEEVTRLTPPFIARTAGGFVIVTGFSDGNIEYLTEGVKERMPVARFVEAWCGTAFLAFPSPDAIEPGYRAHRRRLFIERTKRWVLAALAVFLFLYLFIDNGIWRHVATVLVTLLDMAGIAVSFMLMQKSLNIHTKAADSVCGVIEAGGCDSVLGTKASSFFGIFKWSEVGLTYFTVSLMALLMFPQCIRYLALCNLCCLPFSFWSVWYQKYRAKAWCTLCLCVQALLWTLFFCYLAGGWLHGIFPLKMELFVLMGVYGFVLLALNAISPKFDHTDHNDITE